MPESIAAKGKEIPPEFWESLMQILGPMTKEGYKKLYNSVYTEKGANWYQGGHNKWVGNPMEKREFPSEEYDYMTNPKNRNIVPYMVPEYEMGGGHASGIYKSGKINKNKWGVTTSHDPDTLMVSDYSGIPIHVNGKEVGKAFKNDKIKTIMHELMHVDNPSVGSISHNMKEWISGRPAEYQNYKASEEKFSNIMDNLFKEKQASSSIKDVLELQELDRLRKTLDSFAK